MDDVSQDASSSSDGAPTRRSSRAGRRPAARRWIAVAPTRRSGIGSRGCIEQAGAQDGVSTVLLSSLLGAAGVRRSPPCCATRRGSRRGFGGGRAIPAVRCLRKRTLARLHAFEESFPEALDMLSRAIKAGHAFTTAMGMVADELPDPIGPEFRKTFDEQNFGLPLKDALNNLADAHSAARRAGSS